MMKPFLVLDAAALFGSKTLAGTVSGKALLPKILEAASSMLPGSILAIDFRKTDLVTASFFRACFKAVRDYARRQADFFVVFVCRERTTIEEVEAYANDVGDAFVFADLDAKGDLAKPFLVGALESKQLATFFALTEVGEADAPTLLRKFPDPSVNSSNAWSNRLAALSDKGLISERSEGRSKIYRLIFKEIRLGL